MRFTASSKQLIFLSLYVFIELRANRRNVDIYKKKGFKIFETMPIGDRTLEPTDDLSLPEVLTKQLILGLQSAP